MVAVAVIAWMNLRGIRESGIAFAAPAYLYIVLFVGLIAYGVYRYLAVRYLGGVVPAYEALTLGDAAAHSEGVEFLTLFLILRAFASGSVGLTGTEAIADGVAAFKPSESRNARLVLVVMASCFAVIFTGISFISGWLHIVPDPHEVETINSQLTRTLVGI